MFVEESSLTDASAVNDWNINTSTDFTEMFKGTSIHPNFTKVNGTWNDGTFTVSDS